MLATDQQAIRLTGVGASEVAAVVGLDPYRTPFDVYAAKKGLEKGLVQEGWSDPRTGTPAQRLGHLPEPVVAELYEIAHPTVTLESSGTARHHHCDCEAGRRALYLYAGAEFVDVKHLGGEPSQGFYWRLLPIAATEDN